MSFFGKLLGGVIASGVVSLFENDKENNLHAQAMENLDSFIRRMEAQSPQIAKTFEFEELDSGESLRDLLKARDKRSEAEEQLALFTGKTSRQEKVKEMGKKIAKGEELTIHDFI